MLRITFHHAHHVPVALEKTTEKADLPGLSVKDMYKDGQENQYILKNVKHRTIANILGKDYAHVLFMHYANECTTNPEHATKLADALESVFTRGIFDQTTAILTDEYLEQLFIEKEKHLLSHLTQLNDVQTIKKILNQVRTRTAVLRSHLSETLCNFIHTEILGPCLVKAIWGDQVVAPETFYPDEFNPLNPQIISRFLKPLEDENDSLQRFIEFLQPMVTQHAQKLFQSLPENVQNQFISKNSPRFFDPNPFLIKSFHFWRKLEKVSPGCKPLLKDLELKVYQKRVMGKLYAISLITGHADIFNNIDGTNSGSMNGLPACVDWGNSFNIGFGGLTKAESFIKWDEKEKVAQMILNNDQETLQQIWSSFQMEDLTTEKFTFPYIEQVFPFIPRLLIDNIFNLNDPDIFHGFVEFIRIAHKNIDAVNRGFKNAWPDNPHIQSKLNHAWYAPEGEGPEIVKARIEQLNRVVNSIPKDCKEPKVYFQKALLEEIKAFISHQANPKFKPGC